jgi:hypothetical protein
MNEVEIPLKVTGLGAIKAELRELKGAIADATDPEVMTALAQRAGELKDQLKDANEQIAVFTTGSKFEAVSNSFSMIGSDLASLDFEGANEKAQVFAKNLGALNPGDLAKGFKSFTGVIKTVGGAFVKLGIQILANPIFLLVAVIVAIVVAIGVFLQKIGVLEKILKVVMAPLLALIQGFKDLTDALGLTDNAAEENAEKVMAASKKKEEAHKAEIESQRALMAVTKDMTDEEIKQINKSLGTNIDKNKSMYDLNKEEQQGYIDINNAKIEALENKKELTVEEKAELDKLYAANVDHKNKMVVNEIEKANARRKVNEDITKQIEALNAKQITNETERAKVMLDIQLKESLAKIERQRKELKQAGGSKAELAKLDELEKLTREDIERQKTDITTAANKKRVEDNKAAAAKIESAQDKHLKKLRAQFKIDLDQAVTDGKTKMEIDQMKIDQLIKEREEIEKLNIKKTKIFATEMERSGAVIAMNKDIKVAQDQLEADKIAIADKDAISRINTLMIEEQDAVKRLELQKQLIEQERIIAVNGKELTEQQIKEINAKAIEDTKAVNNEIVSINNDKNAKIIAADRLVQETKLSREQFELERFEGTAQEQIAQQEAFFATQMQTLDVQKAVELAALDLTEAEKEAIREKYRQAKIVAEETTSKKILEIEEKANAKIFKMIDEGFETAKQAANAIASINAIGIGKKLKDVEKGSKEEEKLLKKQFEQQKAFNLAMAAINGAQAILAILSVPDFTLGVASGIRIAASVAATAASIAAITSTSFEGGGSVPSTTPVGSVSSSNTGPMATPNLFGNSNNFNNVSSTNQEDQSTPSFTVTAVVSETEMTSTQNRVNQIQRNAEL